MLDLVGKPGTKGEQGNCFNIAGCSLGEEEEAGGTLVCVCVLSWVQLFMNPWTVASQGLLSTAGKVYHFLLQGKVAISSFKEINFHFFLTQGSSALAGFFTTEPPGKRDSLVAQVVKNACNAGDGFESWVGKILWKRKWQPTPVFLPGEFHGHRKLEGYSPLGF